MRFGLLRSVGLQFSLNLKNLAIIPLRTFSDTFLSLPTAGAPSAGLCGAHATAACCLCALHLGRLWLCPPCPVSCHLGPCTSRAATLFFVSEQAVTSFTSVGTRSRATVPAAVRSSWGCRFCHFWACVCGLSFLPAHYGLYFPVYSHAL